MAIVEVTHRRQDQGVARIRPVLVAPALGTREKPCDAASSIAALQEGDEVCRVAPLREGVEVGAVAVEGLTLVQLRQQGDVGDDARLLGPDRRRRLRIEIPSAASALRRRPLQHAARVATSSATSAVRLHPRVSAPLWTGVEGGLLTGEELSVRGLVASNLRVRREVLLRQLLPRLLASHPQQVQGVHKHATGEAVAQQTGHDSLKQHRVSAPAVHVWSMELPVPRNHRLLPIHLRATWQVLIRLRVEAEVQAHEVLAQIEAPGQHRREGVQSVVVAERPKALLQLLLIVLLPCSDSTARASAALLPPPPRPLPLRLRRRRYVALADAHLGAPLLLRPVISTTTCARRTRRFVGVVLSVAMQPRVGILVGADPGDAARRAAPLGVLRQGDAAAVAPGAEVRIRVWALLLVQHPRGGAARARRGLRALAPDVVAVLDVFLRLPACILLATLQPIRPMHLAMQGRRPRDDEGGQKRGER
mmetsp:Transcript_10216/g.35771  ORF Transcript_10216/g.35771 Transcript_10216/m.35771 type:complete len:477 (+) Transcript_10216:1523-2953(+)